MKDVWVYWNSTRRLYSLKVQGRVVEHRPEVLLRGVAFKVWKGGLARVRAGGRKTPCGFVVGEVVAWLPRTPNLLFRFNPRVDDAFTDVVSKFPLETAESARLTVVGGRPACYYVPGYDQAIKELS